MNDQITPLLNLLTGHLPWLTTIIVWIGALKAFFFFVGPLITKWAANKLVATVDSPDPDDDHFLLLILDSKPYRIGRYLLSLASLPLPTRADYDAALEKKKEKDKTPIIPAIILAFAIGFGLLTASTGCSSAPSRIAYNATASVQTSAELAMAAWNTYVGIKHPSIEDEMKVKDAYEKYQKAMAAVCDIGVIYSASALTNSNGNTGLKAALDQAKADSATALADLVSLIGSFGIKF